MPLTQYERDLLNEGVRHISEAISIVKNKPGTQAVYSHLVDSLAYLYELQSKMESQGVRRKRNPPLILLSNPPVRMHRFAKGVAGHEVDVEGIISTEAHAILYRHFEDGKPYRHDFERPTTLIAADINGRKCVVIESPDGNPIWQDF